MHNALQFDKLGDEGYGPKWKHLCRRPTASLSSLGSVIANF
jgi:hypothetical protein